mmetsp:Transcript_13758/g.52394  ORF Transcript_13758/g.52394 Transcript_13758/m.52394 type:complete len:218 (-) Transcript_13758:878-1531(-)
MHSEGCAVAAPHVASGLLRWLGPVLQRLRRLGPPRPRRSWLRGHKRGSRRHALATGPSHHRRSRRVAQVRSRAVRSSPSHRHGARGERTKGRGPHAVAPARERASRSSGGLVTRGAAGSPCRPPRDDGRKVSTGGPQVCLLAASCDEGNRCQVQHGHALRRASQRESPAPSSSRLNRRSEKLVRRAMRVPRRQRNGQLHRLLVAGLRAQAVGAASRL